MILAVYMTYEVALSCYELIEGNHQMMQDLPENDQRVQRVLKGHNQVPNTARSTIFNSFRSTIQHDPNSNKTPQNCTVDALYLQYWLMFQYHYKSAHGSFSKYYNSIWIMRWVVFAVFSIIWFKYPITLYILFVAIDMFMIFVTFTARKSFRWAFGWILAEEVLIFGWHLTAMILFIDYFGAQKLSQFLINASSHCMFWPYIFTALIEMYLLFAGCWKNFGYFDALPQPVEDLVQGNMSDY
jgi:hypothetical protein